MVKKSEPVIGIMIFFCLLAGLGFVIAPAGCYQWSSSWGGDEDTCNAAVDGNSCRWETPATEVWCGLSDGCCMDKGCIESDLTNQSRCTNASRNGGYNCTWDSTMTMWHPNGSFAGSGGCHEDYSSGSGETWGGMSEGCWNNDGNQQACAGDTSCNWKPNDANQNPSCWIKTLWDAQMENTFATTSDIGCCEQKGCWNNDGNHSSCVNSSSFKGMCSWVPKAQDPYCYDDVGCCYTKMCNEAGDNQTLCTNLKQQMMMPCEWSGSACQSQGGGGFMFFNDTDSCFSQGGWWNSSGDCEMPDSTGGGGFMFAEEAHCWFADNQPAICGNITGCAYCTGTGGAVGSNATSANGINNDSSNNICYNKMASYCEGRDSWGFDVYANANNSRNLRCVDIQIKTACNYGPLPNCEWNASANLTGVHCYVGTSSAQKEAPPVPFCEHPDAINNLTMCNKLSQEYMMPCKWGNASSNKTSSDNCTFNPSAVFGSGSVASGEKEFEVISSEYSCIAAGGTWKKEYYLETGNLKQEQWCEKGAMFDLTTGTAMANKGNCDTGCWACEFNQSGGSWRNSTDSVAQGQSKAEFSCGNSALGYCKWTNDTNAPNLLGWCDYPKEMEYGAGDCQTNCKDCGLMKDPYTSCIQSAVGCKWINDTASSFNQTKLTTGICVDESKKTCDTDCFSCYEFSSCNASIIDCQWDTSNSLCKPYSFDGEICFDGVDNDGDTMVDCSDPDCSFDTSCGGSAFGDCAKYDTNPLTGLADPVYCNNKTAFGNLNCTWINFTWEGIGHCGMPGEDCWQYDNNASGCGNASGCTYGSGSGFSDFCEINMSKEEGLNCWQYTTATTCNAAASGSLSDPNCTWQSSEWGGDNGGWCEYWLFAQCYGYESNQTACQADGNCTWNTGWGDNGMCDMACFNHSLNNNSCIAGDLGDICEWRNSSSSVCMPSTFETMGGGGGGKTGCYQYDGNFSACRLKNYTCVWSNDSSVDNNVSGGGDIDGWCNNKQDYELNGDIEGNIFFLGIDEQGETGVPDLVDVEGFGMRVTDKAYGFGMGLMNLTTSALCNGYNLNQQMLGGGIGSGTNTTKNYWYLDTNYNTTDGCNAIYPNGTTFAGFEFYLGYVVKNNTDTGKIETKKQLYSCVLNASGSYNWAVTNAFVTDNKKFSCFIVGRPAFVTVEKESLENFDSFNITAPMRVFGVSADAVKNRSVPSDSIGPAYYTPGTVDFEFVDCSDPDTKDPKCKSFHKFGFQTFEDCKNGVDDDSDGYTDCDDFKCSFIPACGGTFDFTTGTNDNKAPAVVFSKVDKMADAGIVMFDTDEIANGTLIFYRNSTSCITINKTINDLGDPTVTYDDYKPFHKVVLDSDSLGYALVNGTVYYYKVKVCDTFNNCGTSACLNFTTRKENKNFILRLDVPTGYTVDIPNLNYSGNFTYANSSLLGNEVYDIGIKTNSSQTKNMNITVNNTDLSIKFVGCDVYKPKTLDLESAFITDTTNENIGMNSSSKAWQSLVSELGLGGPGDYIELDIPVAYDADNILNWSDDDLVNGTDVTDYATCNGDTTHTVCKVPTSLGFSVYNIVVASSGGTTTGSGGGGGGGGISFWSNTYTINETEFTEGATKELRKKERVKIMINDESHYVGVISLTTSTATINVSSTPQQAVLITGDVRRFDVTEDGYYDIRVTLNKVVDSVKAELVFKSIHEKVTEVTEAEEEEKEEAAEKQKEKELEEKKVNLLWLLWVVIGIVVVLVIIGLWLIKKKQSVGN